MKEFTISSFQDLHNIIDHKSTSYLYRGQTNSDWELLPRAGRPPYDDNDDKFTLDFFKRHAAIFLKQMPLNNWEWLTIAQHYGVPTRLLDWSKNPLIAAFFAVSENMDCDAAIYRFKYEDYAIIEKIDPFEMKFVTVVIPPANSDRILKQRGYFTIHPKPNVPFSKAPAKGSIEKFIIKKEYRKKLRIEIGNYGYTSFDIFYDLQSLAQAITSRLQNKEDFL